MISLKFMRPYSLMGKILKGSIKSHATYVVMATFFILSSFAHAAIPIASAEWTYSFSKTPIKLGLKHYDNPGAETVFFLHGLGQNDRFFDSLKTEFSFAQWLWSQGFDVWVGNVRNAGTLGFRSDDTPLPHHYTIDDYASEDVPALINHIYTRTGHKPWVIAHSLGAWMMEGYLAGLRKDVGDNLKVLPAVGNRRQDRIKGLVTLSGVYGLDWEKRLANWQSNPILSSIDFYHSNYELEAFSNEGPTFTFLHNLDSLSLDWVESIVNVPFDQIPIIGSWLQNWYHGFSDQLVKTPLLSMFYFQPNCDPEMVRLHGVDSMEDLGPHVMEQILSSVVSGQNKTFDNKISYAQLRSSIKVPSLFFGAGRDRLASAKQVYEKGFLKYGSKDKMYLQVEEAGHLDISSGLNSRDLVMIPTLKWIKDRIKN